jgi:hypothetical protein
MQSRYPFALLIKILFLLLLATGCSGGDDDYSGPPGDISNLLTPYKNEADMDPRINPFSSSHSGLDFWPNGEGRSFQAVSPGKVEWVKREKLDTTNNYQVNILIRYNNTYHLNYVFEPMTNLESDGDIQLSLIHVKAGDTLKAGDIIGELNVKNTGSHVDFGVIKNWNRICPYPYFSEAAKASIERLADGKMCDCPVHQ